MSFRWTKHQTTQWVQAAAKHWDSGLALLCAAVSWSWLPFVEVSQLAKPPVLGRALSWFGYIVMCLISAWVFRLALRYIAASYQKSDMRPVRFLCKAFFVWSAAELAVAWAVTIVWIGRDGSIDSVLPFASFTPLLMYTPFGLLSRFIGFHGLSAAFVTVIVAFSLPKTRKVAMFVVALFALLCFTSWGMYHTPSGEPLSVQLTAEYLTKQNDTIMTDADLVLLPEYGLDDIRNETIDTRVTSADGSEVFFVGSQQRADGLRIGNNLVFGSTAQGIISTMAKKRLIPAGEYLPYAVEAPLRLLGANQTLQTFAINRAVAKGPTSPDAIVIRDDVIIGVGVCASITSPADYRAYTRDGSTVLANIASLEIFRSPVFDAQQEGLARFMAVANARPFLQSANSAVAVAFDHNGHTLYRTEPVSTGQVTITTNQKRTPYTYLGEWTAAVGIALVLFGGIKSRRTTKQKPVNSNL